MSYKFSLFGIWSVQMKICMIFLLVYAYGFSFAGGVFLVYSRGNKNVGRWMGCLVVVLASQLTQ